jgi:large subunit ribosomal protein L25
MESITITGTLRDDLGTKTAKLLRREGNVPCVIYGGEENVHFYTPETSFKTLLYTPEAHLVIIEIDGKSYKAVIRDAQFHPVTDEIEHVDFFELVAGKAVTINVPVKLVGNARGVRNGGRMKVNLRTLKVKATEENLPGYIEHNIENVRIGESVRVKDIKVDGFEIVDIPSRAILTIQTSRNMVEDVEEETEGEEGAAEGAEASTEETASAEA